MRKGDREHARLKLKRPNPSEPRRLMAVMAVPWFYEATLTRTALLRRKHELPGAALMWLGFRLARQASSGEE